MILTINITKGLGYFGRYVKPTAILLPINILEDFTKTNQMLIFLSLSLSLYLSLSLSI